MTGVLKFYFVLVLLGAVQIKSWAQFPPLTRQLFSGSEVVFKKRADISDSTYQLFFGVVTPCQSCTGLGYALGNPVPLLVLHDTCNFVNQYYLSPYLNAASLLASNPFTGESLQKRIFKVCPPGYPEYLTGPLFNQVINPGFKDTFEVLKQYYYSIDQLAGKVRSMASVLASLRSMAVYQSFRLCIRSATWLESRYNRLFFIERYFRVCLQFSWHHPNQHAYSKFFSLFSFLPRSTFSERRAGNLQTECG